MRNRLAGLLLVGALVAGTVGCGGQAPEPAAGEVPAPPPAPAVTAPEPAPEPVEAPPPPPRPLQTATEWNFLELEQPLWQWIFPRGGGKKTAQGVLYETDTSTAGPQIIPLDLTADDVLGVRVFMYLLHRKPGDDAMTEVPFPRNPLLLWAPPGAGDEGTWPFTDENRTSFRQPDPDNSRLWEVDLRGHENWSGPIGRIAIDVPVPELEEGEEHPYNVFVRRIEFLN